MDILFRLRVLVLALLLSAPLLLAVTGCGDNRAITDGAAPDAAVKESEARYNAEIAKQKAAAKRTP